MKESREKVNQHFVIEDTEGEIFGYYEDIQVDEKYDNQQTDNKSFQFNLQSKNNRLDKPMKFEIKDLKEGGIYLYKKSDEYNLIDLGDIRLLKEYWKNESYCWQFEDRFNYHGIKNALCGKTGYGEFFTPKRILVIQMK